MDLVNVILVVGNVVFEVHTFKLEDIAKAEVVFRAKVVANGGKFDIDHHVEEGYYSDGQDIYVCITHSRVQTTTDPRIVDILRIKDIIKQQGTIDEVFMAGNMLVYDSFDDDTRKLVTEISNEGASITNYYQEVEGETEFFEFSELGSPLLSEIREIAESYLLD